MKLTYIILLFGLFTGCSEKKHFQKSSQMRFWNDPLLESFQPDSKKFIVDPTRDTLLILNNRGCKLHISANSFETKEGKLITENINLSFKEYTNAADIAFSGIPMNINIGDSDLNFNSSGMFELEGEYLNEEVKIKPEKPLLMDYSLTQNIPETDFYQLDKDAANWVLVEKIQTIKEKNAPLKLTNDTDRNINITFEDISFYPEFKKYKDVTFRVPDDFKLDTNQLKMLYYQIDLKRTDVFGRYTLTLAGYNDDASFVSNSFPVCPVFKEENFRNAMKNYEALFDLAEKEAFDFLKQQEKEAIAANKKLNKENQAYIKQMAFEKKLQEELIKKQEQLWDLERKQNTALNINSVSDAGHIYPAIIQGLTINSFGIYNCDQKYRMENTISISPEYVDTKGNTIIKPHVLSVIDLNYRGAFSFDPTNFTCDSKGKVVLALFTEEKKLYILDSKDFSKLNLNQSGKIILKMENKTEEIKSSDDLRKYLGV